MKTKHLLLLICLLLLGKETISAQGYLKAEGRKIVNPQGKEVILRGMGLGGWMLQEGYMLRMPGTGTQHSIKARIADLIGDPECEHFYELWLKNHMTKADVDSMAKWGFNSIRLPMHYNLYTLPIEKEPKPNENTWLSKGFAMTDSLLSWCKSNNMYLILDLHAAPGGQGNDINISDRDDTKPSLWDSELNKQKAIALWRKLAERYANESFIGAYDLLNEPNWTFEGKHKNGVEDQKNTDLWKLYADIIKAVREVDKNHIVIIEGNGWGNNYNGFEGPTDKNMVLSFHKYWNANNPESLDRILKLRDKFNVPVWLGESGENSNKWFRDCIALVEANGIGWSWWPLKKISGINNPLTIKAPKGYESLLNYWRNQAPKPSKEVATKVLLQLAENLKAQNCVYHKEVIDAMFRQVSDSTTKAYAVNSVPGRILAADFDLGVSGQAYSDLDSERVDGKSGSVGGNKKGFYRNDGVDIEQSNDSLDHATRFTITSIEDGEWLKYTVDVKKKGNYTIKLRVLPSTTESGLRLVFDKKGGASKLAIPGESKPQWKSVSIGKVSLEKGKQTIKVLIDKGGMKLNYLEFLALK
jgi:hypothetical protein